MLMHQTKEGVHFKDATQKEFDRTQEEGGLRIDLSSTKMLMLDKMRIITSESREQVWATARRSIG